MLCPFGFPARQQSNKRFSICIIVTAESFSGEVVYPRHAYRLAKEYVSTLTRFCWWAIDPTWLAFITREAS